MFVMMCAGNAWYEPNEEFPATNVSQRPDRRTWNPWQSRMYHMLENVLPTSA